MQELKLLQKANARIVQNTMANAIISAKEQGNWYNYRAHAPVLAEYRTVHASLH